MANQIKIKRGLKTDLPTFALAEMGFTTDTEELFIGGSSGNVKIGNNLIIVGSNEKFTSISSAITFAQSLGGKTTILIKPGVYNEQITLLNNNDIDLYGIGNVQVQFASVYPNAPLYASGTFKVYNITFNCIVGGTNSYALHIDDPSITGYVTEFINCTFISSNNAGIGLGLSENSAIRFINCDFASTSTHPVYFHNQATPAVNQVVELIDCKMNSGLNYCALIDDSAKLAGASGSIMRVNMKGCFSNVTPIKFRDGLIERGYIPRTGDISIGKESYTNIFGVDYYKSEIATGGLAYCSNSGLFTIPFANSDLYDITITSAVDENGTDVLANVSIIAQASNYIAFGCSSATVFNKSINMNFVARVKGV